MSEFLRFAQVDRVGSAKPACHTISIFNSIPGDTHVPIRSLALVLLALAPAAAACGEAAPTLRPPAAATTPTTAPPVFSTPPVRPTTAPAEPRVSAGNPSRKPALSGPGTICGHIQPPGNGPTAVVAITKGRMECAKATRVFRTYYRADTPKEGTAGIATVEGWRCISNTSAQANTTGRLSSCRSGATIIVADVIP
jgi:hypothetical protein